tara:strand:+ start:2751 stop:3833 length:1083 start_codon:yes stop_codon:yes gene_type:complete
MSKKILMLCSPGYYKKTGYYYRAIRDKVALENLGNIVDLLVLKGWVSAFKTFLVLLVNAEKNERYVCQNIGSVIPLFFASYFKPKILENTILIYHGSLEDLIAFRFYKAKRFFYELIEARLVELGSTFVCVSHSMRFGLEKKYKNSELKCHVLPNIPSPDFIRNIEAAKEINKSNLRSELKIPQDKIIICYSGNAQAWQNVEFLFNVFLDMPDEFHLLILTIDSRKMNELKEQYKIPDCRITLRTVDNIQVPKYLVAADYLYIVREQSEINEYSCPTKAVEYLYSGTKIICSENLGDISSFVLVNKLGIIISKINMKNINLIRSMIVEDSFRVNELLRSEINLDSMFGTNLQNDVYRLII